MFLIVSVVQNNTKKKKEEVISFSICTQNREGREFQRHLKFTLVLNLKCIFPAAFPIGLVYSPQVSTRDKWGKYLTAFVCTIWQINKVENIFALVRSRLNKGEVKQYAYC